MVKKQLRNKLTTTCPLQVMKASMQSRDCLLLRLLIIYQQSLMFEGRISDIIANFEKMLMTVSKSHMSSFPSLTIILHFQMKTIVETLLDGWLLYSGPKAVLPNDITNALLDGVTASLKQCIHGIKGNNIELEKTMSLLQVTCQLLGIPAFQMELTL